jgi:hypothetical protein
VQVLLGGRSRDAQSGASGGMSLFPTVGKPGVEITCRPRRKVHEQLHEIELRIDVVAAAAAGVDGKLLIRP